MNSESDTSAYTIFRAAFADWPPVRLRAHRERARTRLQSAYDAAQFAKDAFQGFPSDLTAHDAREALIELDDAHAVAQEWGVTL